MASRHRRILNSKLLRNFATPCGLSLRSGRLTAIIWDFPAKNPQISLRETSDNPYVRRNFKKQTFSFYI
jgi:hypothetical protein